MLTRDEFAHHFEEIKEGLGQTNSPLWCAEESTSRCDWFICVKPLRVHNFKKTYWDWCNNNLQGKTACYSSDSENEQEWWGFTDKQDIVLWTLKWM
jgi:hypothetical protein